jgi:NADH-quinone oxidoreductase subunit F
MTKWYPDPKPNPNWPAGYQPVLLARLGKKESTKIDGYLADGGYASWKRVLGGIGSGEWTPAKVTDLVKASGLRGRGGAGFPCGMKWTFVPPKEKRGGKPVYLLCNADESEPGTFKDRLLIEQDPHQLLEGMMLASFALDVKHAYVYIRGEMVHGAEILNAAVAECYAKGLLGKNIQGSGLELDITIHRGAGAYICGEETALIESIEGKRGHPRIKPPFPAVSGAWASPTVVNNVETLCCVKHILDKGPDWFKTMGRNEKNTGPKLYCMSGHVERPGVYETAMGIPFMELLALAGGVRGGKKLKAVIPGGASAAMLTAKEVENLPMDFDGVAAAKSMLGSAAIMVMDETVDIPKAVTNISKFFAHESCGQCTPCREGTPWLNKMLKRLIKGEGKRADLDLLLQIANQMGNGMTICVFADAAIAPVISGVTKFRDEFEAYLAKAVNPGFAIDAPDENTAKLTERVAEGMHS